MLNNYPFFFAVLNIIITNRKNVKKIYSIIKLFLFYIIMFF